MKVKNSEWGKRNRHKRNAHLKLSRAVLKGVVIRKFECEKCTSTIQVEAHHEDYEKPLEVIWLCSKCHHERHVELRKIERGYEDNNMDSIKTKHQYNDSSILNQNKADIKQLFSVKSGKQLVCRKYRVSINTLVKWINEKENQ